MAHPKGFHSILLDTTGPHLGLVPCAATTVDPTDRTVLLNSKVMDLTDATLSNVG
jgi:hypothetical protein